jgi:hypothetical protein
MNFDKGAIKRSKESIKIPFDGRAGRLARLFHQTDLPGHFLRKD